MAGMQMRGEDHVVYRSVGTDTYFVDETPPSRLCPAMCGRGTGAVARDCPGREFAGPARRGACGWWRRRGGDRMFAGTTTAQDSCTADFGKTPPGLRDCGTAM